MLAWVFTRRPLEANIFNLLLALGDSHIFAFGVNVEVAWLNVSEKILSDGERNSGVVLNGGVAGYSAEQYLLRMQDFLDTLNLQIANYWIIDCPGSV